MLNLGPSGSATAAARSMSAETVEHFGCGIWNLPHIQTLSREYPRATQLFLQGSPARDVFFIKRGLIKLVRVGENGQESIMGLRSIGALVGASSMIIGEPHPLSAITTTQCLVFRIPKDVFLELAKTDPQFCWYLHQAHSRELHQQAYQLETLRCLSARERFVRLLWQFIISTSPHERGHLNRVRLPLKNWELRPIDWSHPGVLQSNAQAGPGRGYSA